MISSFDLTSFIDVSQIKKLFLKRHHKLKVFPERIRDLLFVHYKLLKEDFENKNTVLRSILDRFTIAEEFYKDHPIEEHNRKCNILESFLAKYPRRDDSQSKFDYLFQFVQDMLKSQSEQSLDLFPTYQSRASDSKKATRSSEIKNNKTRITLILKDFTGYLHKEKHLKPSKIAKLLPLTQNQLKKTFQIYKKHGSAILLKILEVASERLTRN